MTVTNTTMEALVQMSAALKFIIQTAQGRRIQGSDPRYDAVLIAAKDLSSKLDKLIAPAMLAEIATMREHLRELYKAFNEPEESSLVVGSRDN